jgi:ribosomal protein L28
MSRKQCDLCQKKPMPVTKRKLLRGNYNPCGKKTQLSNVQPFVYDDMKLNACTKCIRTMNKNASV